MLRKLPRHACNYVKAHIASIKAGILRKVNLCTAQNSLLRLWLNGIKAGIIVWPGLYLYKAKPFSTLGNHIDFTAWGPVPLLQNAVALNPQ